MFKNFRKRWAKEPEFKATAAKEPEFKATAENKPEPNPNCEVIRVLRFKNNLYVVGDMITVVYYGNSDGPTRELEIVYGKIMRIGEGSCGYPSYIRLDTSTRFHSKTMDITVDDIDTIALWEDEDAVEENS